MSKIEENVENLVKKTIEDLNYELYDVEYANLKNVLTALAGLYSLELLAYKIVADNNNEKVFVPVIHSIFQVNNLYWTNISNGSGYVLMDDSLFMEDAF